MTGDILDNQDLLAPVAKIVIKEINKAMVFALESGDRCQKFVETPTVQEHCQQR